MARRRILDRIGSTGTFWRSFEKKLQTFLRRKIKSERGEEEKILGRWTEDS
jgi:hypothetical protein